MKIDNGTLVRTILLILGLTNFSYESHFAYSG